MKFLIIFLLLTFISLESAKVYNRFTKVSCNTSNLTAVNAICYIRAYDRRYPVINIEAYFTRPIANAKLTVQLFHKQQQNSAFKQILDIKNLEFCRAANEASSTPFLKSAFDWIQSIAQNVFLICSKSGSLGVHNISIPDSIFMAAFPTGNYRSIYHISDDIDKNIFNFSCWSVIINK